MAESRLALQHDDISRWVEAGFTRKKIAALLGVNESVARRYINRYVLGSGGAPAAVGSQGLPEEGGITREELLSSENAELRRRLTTDRKADVAQERILTAVEEAVSRVEIPWQNPADLADYGRYLTADDDAHHRAVLVLSDFHGGEVVDPDQVNGVNAYSWAIMEARVDETIAAVLSHKRRSPELTGLDVLFVGDMCSGANHEELAETNEYVLAEQGVRMGYLQGQLIERLAPHFAEIKVVVIPGNHPRLTKKPAAKNVHNNMDWVAGTIAREYLRDYAHVTVTCPLGNATFHEVAGRTLYLMHGDGIRSTMPGVPWGGVMRRANAIQAQHRKRAIDHFVLGHFHQPNIVQGGRIIMNGSLKGADEWCLKQFGEAPDPEQFLLLFDEKRSRLTDIKRITPTTGLPE